MPNKSKKKGYRLEVELVEEAQAAGLTAIRAWGSNGRSIGQPSDVDLIVESAPIQAKRRAKLPSYLVIPASCAAVVFRQDRGESLALVRYKDLLEWLKLMKT